MGRGNRPTKTLALAPLPPAHDPRWLASFTLFERETLHVPGVDYLNAYACELIPPHGAPRFVMAYARAHVVAPHAFIYYPTAKLFLHDLVATFRTPSVLQKYVWEYHPATAAFTDLLLTGDITGYTPPVVKPSSSRGRRLRAIKAARPDVAELNTTLRSERFLLICVNAAGTMFPVSARSLPALSRYLSHLSRSAAAFVEVYDLDVSDQPVSVQLSLSYVASDGTKEEVVEQL